MEITDTLKRLLQEMVVPELEIINVCQAWTVT